MSTTTVIEVAIAAWLTGGLMVEGWLARRQWRHLGRLQSAGDQPRRVLQYRQRRALLRWLESVEAVIRVALWLPAGLLALAYMPFAAAGFDGAISFVVVFALGDGVLRQGLPWLRWRWVDRPAGVSHENGAAMVGDSAREVAVHTLLAAVAAPWLLWPFAVFGAPLAWPVSALMLLAGLALQGWAKTSLIAPLFNEFRSLPAGDLRARLEAMMQRCKTRMDDVRVMDASRRSAAANAYFTGFGRSKRVVLFDTLIERLEPAEIEAVMAHELVHFRCGHLQRYYGLLGALLAVAYTTFGLLQTGLETNTAAPMALAAIHLLLPALAWPLQPILAGRRRRYEFEADAYAVRYSDARALRTALEKLFANNLAAPSMDPLYAAFYATHPPESQRLARVRHTQPAPSV